MRFERDALAYLMAIGEPAVSPLTIRWGEVLVGEPMSIFSSTSTSFSLPIPERPELIGTTVFLQGAILFEGRLELRNALRGTLGY